MTRSAFQQAMCCGLGRCVLALQKLDDPTSLYDTVLWGCLHNIAYDAQSEGTRAYYMWSLVQCFGDITPFAEAVAEKFRTCRSNGEWAFTYYSELLGYFAQDGSQLAQEALQDRYRKLYDRLKKLRCPPSVFPERDDFEQLCMVRIQEGPDRYLVIAEDIGRLMLENPLYGDDCFEQLDAQAEHLFGRRRITALLKRTAGENPAIAAYWMAHRRSDEKCKTAKTTRMAEAADAIRNPCFLESMSALDLLMVRTYIETGGEEATVSYAAAALATEGNRRAEMLHNWRIASRGAPWPLSVETLFKVAMDGDERSRIEATAIFENTPCRAVREEALRLIEKTETKGKGAALLCQNYQPNDQRMLTAVVRSLPVSCADDRWHTVYISVLRLFQRKGQKGLPKELLMWIYGHSLCSCCRKAALWEMGRRRMLTRAILEECRYDSNESIRLYAERRIDSQKKDVETI